MGQSNVTGVGSTTHEPATVASSGHVEIICIMIIIIIVNIITAAASVSSAVSVVAGKKDGY